MKLSFRRQPKLTGLSAVGYSHRPVDIKLDGKIVGYISAPNWQTKHIWKPHFSVMKTVPDDDTNCDWKWISFKNTDFETEELARQWVKENIGKISEKYTFHLMNEET